MNKELNAGTEADNGVKPIVLPSASLAQSPLLSAALSVVAVFMGMERTEKLTGEPTFKQQKNCVIWASQLMYNSSWDWFMPAYKHFSSLTGQPMPTFIIHYRNISQWVERVNIEEAFKSLVNAITWYNDINGLSIGSR